jgi:hypothetical protein
MGATFLAAKIISQRDYEVGMKKIEGMKRLLADLEEADPDPSLNGLRRGGEEMADV